MILPNPARMKKPSIYLYLLMSLLLANGIMSCGKPIDQVPDLTVDNTSNGPQDEKNQVQTLDTQWQAHLKLLPEDQRRKLGTSIAKLQPKARDKLRTMIEFIPDTQERAALLRDFASFSAEETSDSTQKSDLVRIFLVFIHLGDTQRATIKEVFSKGDKASRNAKVAFYRMGRDLKGKDQELFCTLIEKMRNRKDCYGGC